jgi:Zn-dependent protease
VKGTLRIGSWRGVPVSIHWSAPIGFLLFFSFQFRPVGWLVLAAIILIHEAGHAFLVRRFRLVVYSIVLTGTGGECTWAGHATPAQRAIIAWGGVLAQVPLLLIGLALDALLPPKAPALVMEAATTLVSVNVMLIAFNLLPIPGLDGWQAWRIFAPSNLGSSWTTIRRAFLRKRARELEDEMAQLVRNRKVR